MPFQTRTSIWHLEPTRPVDTRWEVERETKETLEEHDSWRKDVQLEVIKDPTMMQQSHAAQITLIPAYIFEYVYAADGQTHFTMDRISNYQGSFNNGADNVLAKIWSLVQGELQRPLDMIIQEIGINSKFSLGGGRHLFKKEK